MNACECPFLSHHLASCREAGVCTIGKATSVTLCRECLAYLFGYAEAARHVAGVLPLLEEEAKKRSLANLRIGQENGQNRNDSPTPSKDGIDGRPADRHAKESAVIAARAVGTARPLLKEEARKRQAAGLMVGNEQKPNDSPSVPYGTNGGGPSTSIAPKAAPAQPKASGRPLFRFG
jgi:hypothetical protein